MTDNLEQGQDETPPPQGRHNLMPAMWLINLVAVVILLIWVTSIVVRIVWPDRGIVFPPSIDGAMLIVAGFLFAGNLKERWFTNGGDDKR